MSNSIPEPWIVAYLMGAGETHGASLSAIPRHVKPRKARWTEILSYEPSNPEASMWVKVSDHSHELPARLSTTAIAEHNRLHPDVSLPQSVGALLKIKEFRPIFTRVPVGQMVKQMSQEFRLALEIGFIEVLGSAGEDFPNAKDIETDPKLQEWTCGLRGDGGNILMRRKQEMEAASPAVGAAKSPRKGAAIVSAQKISLAATAQAETNGNGNAYGRRQSPNSGDLPDSTNLWRLRKKDWDDIMCERYQYLRPKHYKAQLLQDSFLEEEDEDEDISASPGGISTLPRSQILEGENEHSKPLMRAPVSDSRDEPRRHALDLGSSPPPQTPEPASHHRSSSRKPTTPSIWSPSVHGSPNSGSDSNEIVPRPSTRNRRSASLFDASPAMPSADRRSIRDPSPDSVSPSQPVHEPDAAEDLLTITTSTSYLTPPTPAQRPNPNANPRPKASSPVASSPPSPPPTSEPKSSLSQSHSAHLGPPSRLPSSQPMLPDTDIKRGVPYAAFHSDLVSTSGAASQPRTEDDSMSSVRAVYGSQSQSQRHSQRSHTSRIGLGERVNATGKNVSSQEQRSGPKRPRAEHLERPSHAADTRPASEDSLPIKASGHVPASQSSDLPQHKVLVQDTPSARSVYGSQSQRHSQRSQTSRIRAEASQERASASGKGMSSQEQGSEPKRPRAEHPERPNRNTDTRLALEDPPPVKASVHAPQSHLSTSRQADLDLPEIVAVPEDPDSEDDDNVGYRRSRKAEDVRASPESPSEQDELDSDDAETKAALISSTRPGPRSGRRAQPAKIASGPQLHDSDDVFIDRKPGHNEQHAPSGKPPYLNPPAKGFAVRANGLLRHKQGAALPSGPSSGQPPQHDPVAWSRPSFMRQADDQSKGKGKMPSVRQETIKLPSPPPEPMMKASGSKLTSQKVIEPTKPKAIAGSSKAIPSQVSDAPQTSRQALSSTASSLTTKAVAQREIVNSNVPRLDLATTSTRGKRSRSSGSTGTLARSSDRKRRKVEDVGSGVSGSQPLNRSDGKDRTDCGKTNESITVVKDEPASPEIHTSSKQPARLLKLKGFRADFDAMSMDAPRLPPMTQENVRDCLLVIGRARQPERSRGKQTSYGASHR